MSAKTNHPINPNDYVEAIHRSGLTIYDPIPVGHPDLWIPARELETLLNAGLRGVSLAELPLRTRSKVAKQLVCRVLGYPVPTSFRKTQPRFPGQLFDTYVQKANNLQVWNEALSSERRYVLIRPSEDDVVYRVKVVNGDRLAELDKTGKLTQKYQATCIRRTNPTELITDADTNLLATLVAPDTIRSLDATPVTYPLAGELLPIRVIFDRLRTLIGATFADAGVDQERNRGAALHRLVCSALGYHTYQDDGQFPDIKHQLIEVKLQTSPTIDLGLVTPDSTSLLDMPMVAGKQLRHCDVRYAVFYGHIEGGRVDITHLFLTTGEGFFTRFQQFQGNVLNRKQQIHLPGGFFEG
jgi:hypothetical protein